MRVPSLLLAVGFQYALAVDATQIAPIVDLGYASFQGVFDPANNISTFSGIRYAAPPVEDFRWAPPQPPATITGVVAASTPPPACYQGSEGAALALPTSISQHKRLTQSHSKRQSATSEDCLFLSVSVPGTIKDADIPDASGSLPVVVWIHGGGYDIGWEAMYNQTDLVIEAQGGIIAVAIQYRLGLFGFLAGQELKEGGGALNAGLLDQEFALQWVQKYIHLFGGNSSAVTIWGESAGAGSVLQHIVAHGGKTTPPLFRSAMTSSTYLPPQYNYDGAIPQARVALFDATVNGTNCTSTTANDTLACLRKADVDNLQSLNVNLSASGLFGTFVFVPVVDGGFIIESPVISLAENKVNGNDLLSVTNAFEGLIFVSNLTSAASNTSTYIQELWPSASAAQVEKGTELYQTVSNDLVTRAIGIYGESLIICPTYWLLPTFSGRSWKGEFAVPPGIHGEDIEYYFPGLELVQALDSPIFAQTFAQSFLSFAINQSPNEKINSSTLTPYWNTYSSRNTEMLFNSTNGVAADSQPIVKVTETDAGLLERCAFWQEVSAAASED